MEIFEAPVYKDDASRRVFLEIPFNARERFCKPKGTIYVSGTINDTPYRCKLLSRGGGNFLMVLNKSLQKSIGFNGQTINALIAMSSEELESVSKKLEDPVSIRNGMDVLTAIKTRQSIRNFTQRSVQDDMVMTMLCCGMHAPTAKNKQPYHFIVIRNRQLLTEFASQNSQAAMLESAAGAIVVCGDKNVEGMKEFLYADCAAASQNILLGIHGLGLGGVWCGVASNSDWRKLIIAALELPSKLEPVAVIAFGWPDEEKELQDRWALGKIHYDKW